MVYLIIIIGLLVIGLMMFINRKKPQYEPPYYPKIISKKSPTVSKETLEQILSGDKGKVRSASYTITRTRDQNFLSEVASHLDEIIENTNKLIRRGTNLKVHELDHPIIRLCCFLNGQECLCSMYVGKGFSHYDPEREVKQNHVKLLSKELHESGWGHVWQCECNDCGTKYQVEYREYHGPWWHWEHKA